MFKPLFMRALPKVAPYQPNNRYLLVNSSQVDNNYPCSTCVYKLHQKVEHGTWWKLLCKYLCSQLVCTYSLAKRPGQRYKIKIKIVSLPTL